MKGGKTSWTVIKVPQNILTPRQNPAVAPINDNEIALLGGLGFFGDVIIFDRKTETCKKVMNENNYRFRCIGN